MRRAAGERDPIWNYVTSLQFAIDDGEKATVTFLGKGARMAYHRVDNDLQTYYLTQYI